MTTFIDKDTGAEYEEVVGLKVTDGLIIIEPVNKPKWEVKLRMSGLMNPTVQVELFDIASVDQAQLIKDCCESLMIEIFKPNHTNGVWLDIKIDRARQAIKGQDD